MHRPRLARALPITVTVAVALLGAACSDDDGDTALVDSRAADQTRDETTQATEASGDPQDAEAAVEAGGEGSTDQGQTSDDGGGGSLGSSTGELPGLDAVLVPLRIEVTSLERSGELVEVAMTLTNEHDDARYIPYADFRDTEHLDQTDLSGVRLIDQGERKAYLPVLDSDGVCLCTKDLNNVQIQAGESLDLHASFGGIRDSITTLDLDVPGFELIAGLEVQG